MKNRLSPSETVAGAGWKDPFTPPSWPAWTWMDWGWQVCTPGISVRVSLLFQSAVFQSTKWTRLQPGGSHFCRTELTLDLPGSSSSKQPLSFFCFWIKKMRLPSSQYPSPYFVATMKSGNQFLFSMSSVNVSLGGTQEAPNLPVLLTFTHYSLDHPDTHTWFFLPLGITFLLKDAPFPVCWGRSSLRESIPN